MSDYSVKQHDFKLSFSVKAKDGDFHMYRIFRTEDYYMALSEAEIMVKDLSVKGIVEFTIDDVEKIRWPK